jgi:two-component system OmpR family sensor kinase
MAAAGGDTTPGSKPAGPGLTRRLYRPGRIRRWLAGRTLRARLIAGLLVLLALACAAVGVATYIALNRILLDSLDQQLATANMSYATCLSQPAPEDSGDNPAPAPPRPSLGTPQTCAQQQADDTFTAQLRGGQLSYPKVHDGPGHWRLSAADLTAIKALPPGVPCSVTLSDLGPYRLVAFSSHHHPGLSYVSGLPLEPVSSALRNVEVVEVVVFAIALVVTGVAGTGWVRLSLRPLRRVAATATRVTQLPLASGEVTLPERVPDMDPRTEIGQVGTALNRMLGHVEAALARRAASEARLRRFAADASHELRTPLAAIRGYAELARRHPGPVPGDIAHALRRVESESARMSVLVDELLLLAQLDAGRPLAQEPVDLTRLAIDATSDARVANADHRWQLELPDEPVLVRGDEHRLRQVLANLVANAGRHTPPGTTVLVALADKGPGKVGLTVTDNGPGIASDLVPGLFERFVRGDTSRSRAAGSTGLGLAIVDAVTTAHGGTVDVTSRPGHTRFTITLPRLAGPLVPEPAGASRGPADPPGPPAGSSPG